MVKLRHINDGILRFINRHRLVRVDDRLQGLLLVQNAYLEHFGLRHVVDDLGEDELLEQELATLQAFALVPHALVEVQNDVFIYEINRVLVN